MTPYWHLFDFRHHRSLCARYELLNQHLWSRRRLQVSAAREPISIAEM